MIAATSQSATAHIVVCPVGHDVVLRSSQAHGEALVTLAETWATSSLAAPDSVPPEVGAWSDPYFEDDSVAVRLPVLDRVHRHVAAAHAGRCFQYVFVVSRHVPDLTNDDTLPLWPLLERWCRSRGLAQPHQVVVTEPTRRDAVFDLLLDQLGHAVRLHQPSGMTLVFGPSSAAVQLPLAFSVLEELADEVGVLDAAEALPVAGPRGLHDTEVVHLRLPEFVTRRTTRQQVYDLIQDQWEFEDSEAIARSAPPGTFGAEELALLAASRAYVRRDRDPLLAMADRLGLEPRALDEGRAVADVCHLVDLVEYGWHRGDDWSVLFHLSLLIVEHLPAAWLEHAHVHAGGASLRWEDILSKLGSTSTTGMFSPSPDFTSYGGTDRVRPWLYAAGADVFCCIDGGLTVHRNWGVPELGSDVRAHVWWQTAFRVLRDKRNLLAHSFLEVHSEELRTTLKTLCAGARTAAEHDFLSLSGVKQARARSAKGRRRLQEIEEALKSKDALGGLQESLRKRSYPGRGRGAKQRARCWAALVRSQDPSATITGFTGQTTTADLGHIETMMSLFPSYVADHGMPGAEFGVFAAARTTGAISEAAWRGLMGQVEGRLDSWAHATTAEVEAAIAELPDDFLLPEPLSLSPLRKYVATLVPEVPVAARANRFETMRDQLLDDLTPVRTGPNERVVRQ